MSGAGNRLTIVVVRYLTEDDRYLDHLARYTRGYDLISVDNTAENAPLTTLWNRWLRRAATPYVCLMNPDVLVGPGWADACLAAFAAPRVVMVGPRMSGEAFRVQHEDLARAPGQTLRRRIERTSRAVARRYGRRLLDRPVQGSCFFLDRRRVLELGGLDERFPFYGQDKDLFLTVRAARLRCVIAQGAHVHHLGSVSTRRAMRLGLFDKNAQWLLRAKRFRAKWGIDDIGGTEVVEARPRR